MVAQAGIFERDRSGNEKPSRRRSLEKGKRELAFFLSFSSNHKGQDPTLIFPLIFLTLIAHDSEVSTGLLEPRIGIVASHDSNPYLLGGG